MNINIQDIINVAKKAGEEIIKIYNQDFRVEYKADDSPLTKADLISQKTIETKLKELYPEIPLLGEESEKILYSERSKWNYFWLVDPLDGTKEFVKKNGEFTVNIALIHKNNPILGVVYVPINGKMYYADENGAYKEENGKTVKIKASDNSREKLIIVVSRSHFNKETQDYIDSLGKPYESVSAGSALKICLVAEGKADLYPRLGPTMEWDTAAAHAIVKYAGKNVFNYETKKELVYNKEDLLNPWFLVE